MAADVDPAVRRKARLDTAIILSPLGVGVLLNAIVRPWLSTLIDAEEIRRGSSVRGSNRWWAASPESAAEQPAISWFLGVSDGAIAAVLMLSCGVIALAMWIRGRRVRRREAQRLAATQSP